MTRIGMSLVAAALALAGTGLRAQEDAAAPEASHVLNFDAFSAPSTFSSTTQLTGVSVDGQNIQFDGSSINSNNGGAVLNFRSGFGVTGYSSPNFLAFNCNRFLADGGVPRSPEIITFPRSVRAVSLRAGSGLNAGTTLRFYGLGNTGVEVRDLTLRPFMQTVTFALPLQRILITTTNACAYVIDDLRWTDR